MIRDNWEQGRGDTQDLGKSLLLVEMELGAWTLYDPQYLLPGYTQGSEGEEVRQGEMGGEDCAPLPSP